MDASLPCMYKNGMIGSGWHEFPMTDPCLRPLVCRCVWLRTWNHHGLRQGFWRVYVNDRPGAWLDHAGRSWPLRPGHLLIVPPNLPLHTRLERPVRHLYLHIQAPPPRTTMGPVDRPIDPTLAPLIEWYLAAEPPGRADPTTNALRAMRLAAAALEGLLGGGQASDDRIEQVVAMMTADPARRFGNRHLADAIGMQVDAFVRLFRRRVGTTPHVFLTDRRIDEAARLLRESDTSIPLIAERLGFVDRYHLSRAFARRLGMPPARWRSQA